MINREKVIKGLESLRNICNAKSDMAIGEGKVAWAGYANTAGDALALLKAQEPVEPVEMIDDFYPIGDPLRTNGWRCGICGERIAGHDNFCPNCGRAVKWDD